MCTNATQTQRHAHTHITHQWTHDMLKNAHTWIQSDTPTGKLYSALVSWVSLFGRNWIWQSSFSTVNNTETNEFIFSTPLLFSCPLHTFALMFPLFFSLVLPSVSYCLYRRCFSSSFLSYSYCFSFSPLPYNPSWTSSLYLHRWFQWLLWVLIILSITVGKCAMKVDSYSAPCGSIFIRVTPDFRGSRVFWCSMPSFLSPLGMCEGHLRGTSTFYFPELFLCRDSQ